METNSVDFVHTVPGACRVLPSDSRWNSIEFELSLLPKSSEQSHSLPSKYSKSVDYNLIVTDKAHFNRFICVIVFLVFAILAIVLLLHFLPKKHHHLDSSNNLTIPISQALLFFDAQKSGNLPENYPVKFRGDSGLNDGNTSDIKVDLVGGFYDSGNNIKFSFTTAYTVTLLSWSAIEYHYKFVDVGELDHIKDIIKWGTDYLLKVGSASNKTSPENDISCWQRPEDMIYPRPVLVCKNNSTDLAGEIVAALSAASLVFRDKHEYSRELVKAAEKLYGIAIRDYHEVGTYTMDDQCGGEARQFYNSTSSLDELAWGATWLFFATGNPSHLNSTTEYFKLALEKQLAIDKGVYYWNNKIAANALLLARLRYFHDPGQPYVTALKSSSNMTESLICSYLSDLNFKKTPGGLILLKPSQGSPLEYAATASFLSKLYHDYLHAMRTPGVDYILGKNPMKMSYLVGYGETFPKKVHHRGASIPSDNQKHSCAEGNRWLYSKDSNPNVLKGGMVAGPDEKDHFTDDRNKPEYTEPRISSNAGLVAALVALHELPYNSSSLEGINGGLDQTAIFKNIHMNAQ
ncbi:hypothetical protein Scep_002309 [Stephania cephalantha]|uniref:Endoglucanase n=1 Tax=Stephania cephalantha TaxID=152367 RepID=A0AAP0LAZ3_9MAGN